MMDQDDALRELLASCDPAPGARAPDGLLDRVLDDIRPGAAPVRRGWLQRHWQGSLIAAAAVASVALAVPVIAPGLTANEQSDTASPLAGAVDPAYRGAPATGDSPAGPATTGSATDDSLSGSATSDTATQDSAPSGSGTPDSATADSATGLAPTAVAAAAEPSLVRSASLTVGTGDPDQQAEAFTATVAGLGGRVVSQTVVTTGGGTPPPVVDTFEPGMPSPVYPSGPGVYLTVQVPEDRFEEALQAARASGEVVQLQQSSYDVSAEVADVDARIETLRTSLATLNGLLGRATDVSDVIALESAISQRQAELDGLLAQQRQLADQTEMSSISLTLMTPRDARQSVDPQPPGTWWSEFLDGLAELWTWVGRALLITSPLLLAAAVIWWVRKRRRAAPSSST